MWHVEPKDDAWRDVPLLTKFRIRLNLAAFEREISGPAVHKMKRDTASPGRRAGPGPLSVGASTPSPTR